MTQGKPALSPTVTIRLTHELIAQLKAMATEDKRTVSAYIRLRLEDWVNKKEK